MIKFNAHRMFTDKKGNEYLFLINNNSLFRLDKKSKNMLKLEGLENEQAYKYLSSVMTVDETDELFNNMKQSGLLVDEKKSISNKIEETAVSPMGVTLMIIQECNLRCTYCYGEGGEYQDRGKMSLDIAKNQLIFLLPILKTKICWYAFWAVSQ